jgi:hypothetical protein
MKQTAVEWLVDELQKAEYIPKNSDIIDYVINQALEMEKEQIKDADVNGSFRTAEALDCKISLFGVKELAQQYYEETFNKG